MLKYKSPKNSSLEHRPTQQEANTIYMMAKEDIIHESIEASNEESQKRVIDSKI